LTNIALKEVKVGVLTKISVYLFANVAISPIFKQARAQKKKVKLVRDKLIIDGQLYTGST
jgi:hypothetical protein